MGYLSRSHADEGADLGSLLLQHRLAVALAGSETLTDGTVKALQIIGQRMRCDLGAFWRVDERAQALRAAEVWHSPDFDDPELIRALTTWQVGDGNGLPGRVWRSRGPVWISKGDDDSGFPKYGGQAALRGCFGFPVFHGENVLGVMEFWCRETRAPEEGLFQEIAVSGGELGRYMNHLLAEEELRTAVRNRDDFFSIASHELRIPLTSLSLQVQMAKRKLKMEASFAPDMLANVFASLEKQVHRLTELVDELLDTSRIQAGKFYVNFERINLSDEIKGMVERFIVQLEKAQCPLDIDIENGIVGNFDQRRIEQVVDNLLSNVVKYAPGKPLKVSLHRADKVAKLVVEDGGPGIPAESRPRIFERFKRGANSAHVTGLGLGLYIVNEIVGCHRGSVHLESDEGKGSRFVVELPLDEACREAEISHRGTASA